MKQNPITLTLAIANLLLTTHLCADEAKPTERRVLVMGSHVMLMPSLGTFLSHAGYCDTQAVVCVRTGPHPQPEDAVKLGLLDWIAGNGDATKAKKGNTYLVGTEAQVAACAQGKISVAVMELDYRGCISERYAIKTRESVLAFAEATRKAGIRGVVFLMPDPMTATHERGGKPLPIEWYRNQYASMDKAYSTTLEGTGLTVVPMHRIYLALREKHPEVDIHAFFDGHDGRHSWRDKYLMVCALAAVIVDKKPEGLPDRQKIEAQEREWLLTVLKGYLAPAVVEKSGPMDDALQRTLHDVVWSVCNDVAAKP